MKLNEDFTNLYKRWKNGEVRKEDKFDYNLIDLSLPSGTLWMDRNIGADTIVDYGGYYACGETEEKDKYSWDTYKFGRDEDSTKYNEEDGKTVLEHEDDVVYQKTKGKAHMPTREQIEELLKETNHEWVKDYKGSGVNGRLFTSKTNDNSIFIPASGYQRGSGLKFRGYWASLLSGSLRKSNIYYGIGLYCNSDNGYLYNYNRSHGCSVRGVKKSEE